MELYDDIYHWEGFGGALHLGSGRCRLRIYDLKKHPDRTVAFMKPFLVVAADLPKERLGDMSVKSCNSHIATCVAREFSIDPHRMQFIEYYPAETYGQSGEFAIAERFEAVAFTWYGDKAMKPIYRPLEPPVAEFLRQAIAGAFID